MAVLAAMQNDAISSSTKPQRNLATARLQHVGRTTRRVRKTLAMNEIRRLAARGYSHGEIMDAVGLPERTYYRYLVEVLRHDRELLEEEDVEIFATELSIFKERILNSYRRLVMIATREKSSDRDKIDENHSMQAHRHTHTYIYTHDIHSCLSRGLEPIQPLS